MFERVSFDADEIAATIDDLADMMRERRGARSFVASTENPLIVVLIDEVTSLFDAMDTKQAATAEKTLRVVLSQGRSLGVVVCGFGQETTKERLRLRDLFPQRVALRLATPTETKTLLGDAAIEQGARPHDIPPATPSNGYATAGIAYVRAMDGTITRSRFAQTTDGEIAAICGEQVTR